MEHFLAGRSFFGDAKLYTLFCNSKLAKNAAVRRASFFAAGMGAMGGALDPAQNDGARCFCAKLRDARILFVY